MPRRGISKRKLKDQKSQRVKKPRKGTNATEILTPELLAELGECNYQPDHSPDSLLVIEGRSKSEKTVTKAAEKSRLSKNELRKLKQVGL